MLESSTPVYNRKNNTARYTPSTPPTPDQAKLLCCFRKGVARSLEKAESAQLSHFVRYYRCARTCQVTRAKKPESFSNCRISSCSSRDGPGASDQRIRSPPVRSISHAGDRSSQNPRAAKRCRKGCRRRCKLSRRLQISFSDLAVLEQPQLKSHHRRVAFGR